MAPKQMYGVLAVILTILPSLALATDFMVGDASGWTINFDYEGWAANKVFRVGDRLVFIYPVGNHNVIKVNGTDFQTCTVPPGSNPLSTGYDIIPLASVGNKWYICGKPNHCSDFGQKLKITVMEAESPAPSPATTISSPDTGYSSANVILASGYHAFVAIMALIALMVMV